MTEPELNYSAALATAICRELTFAATYKPAHTLRFDAIDRKIVFNVSAYPDDSHTRRPNQHISYTYVIVLPKLLVRPNAAKVHQLMLFVTEQVRKALHAFEQHECDEWWQVNGVQVHPPHKHYEEYQ